MIYFAQIEYGTPEYDLAVRLRTDILRKPIGLEFSIEQLAAEWADTHFACFDAQDNLIGCLILTKKDEKTIKMRQVAVADWAQKKGVGQKMVAGAEQWARQNGYSKMGLNARETAVSFYLKLNYTQIGPHFEEVGLTHFSMEKQLGI